MQRSGRTGTARATGCLLLLMACGPQVGCSAPYEAVRQIKDATVPPGDAAAPLGAPSLGKFVLEFTWEFTTHLTPAEYLDWANAHLAHQGFTIQRRDPGAMRATRVDAGDAYRVHLEFITLLPTRVKVTLRASPD